MTKNDFLKPKIAASILAADFGHMADQARQAQDAGAEWLHLDVMDGHFVPNISFGPDMVAALRKAVTIPLDVHLMISHPDRYARAFVEAGADNLTVHLEAPHNVDKTISLIRGMGCKCGLAINPATLADKALPYLREIDLMLVMTVNPGFGGQNFMVDCLEKVRVFREAINRDVIPCELEVDGGVNLDTIGPSARAGANVFVCGTSIFRQNIRESVTALRQKLA
ncbi:MAG: ribulose-phosphate 3-epimerase [Verrucomicrobiae bacterium]|nr:ribulose-phosphate 3-epimerase [Verrucomicrobiae bacterium]